jgi:hypothetical protein
MQEIWKSYSGDVLRHDSTLYPRQVLRWRVNEQRRAWEGQLVAENGWEWLLSDNESCRLFTCAEFEGSGKLQTVHLFRSMLTGEAVSYRHPLTPDVATWAMRDQIATPGS